MFVVVAVRINGLPVPTDVVPVCDVYQATVPVAQVADNETVLPAQIVVVPLGKTLMGDATAACTVTTTSVNKLEQFPLSHRTLYIVFDERFAVLNGEPENKSVTLFELYHFGVPVTQVADSDVFVLLQIVGFEVPVGDAANALTFTTTLAKLLKQLPFSHLTL